MKESVSPQYPHNFSQLGLIVPKSHFSPTHMVGRDDVMADSFRHPPPR